MNLEKIFEIEKSKLSASEKLILFAFCIHSDKMGKVNIYQKTISEYTSLSLWTTNRTIKNLVDKGFLNVEKSQYQIILDVPATQDEVEIKPPTDFKALQQKYDVRKGGELPATKSTTKTTTENVYNQIMIYWNQNKTDALPSCRTMTKQRKIAIKNRLSEYTVKDIFKAMDNVFTSDFCNGKNNNAWVANFDFIFQASKISKCLEGCYDNRQPKTKKDEWDEFNQSIPKGKYYI